VIYLLASISCLALKPPFFSYEIYNKKFPLKIPSKSNDKKKSRGAISNVKRCWLGSNIVAQIKIKNENGKIKGACLFLSEPNTDQ
jgi:hypothetical protein